MIASFVYAKCNIRQRRKLLYVLEVFGVHQQYPWVICRDFNNILTPEERIGCHTAQPAINDFNNFLLDVGVMDVGYTGNRYIWSRKENGLCIKWARLDRFLINHQ